MTDDDSVPDDVREAVEEFADALAELSDALPDEYGERVEFHPDEGIYENASLETAGGDRVRLSSAYYWSTNYKGYHLVDVPDEELPDRDVTEFRLQIHSTEGAPLLGGRVADVGMKDGLDGNTTLIVDPAEESVLER